MRPSKLEWVVEKGTELGADAFWIYLAEHSEKETLSEHQLERLSYIAISAMKQCGRSDLPPIAQFPHLKALLTHSPLPCLFGDVRPAAKPMREVVVDQALFITGPERGFSQGEVKILEEKGTGVHLHKNILRAETAPLAALSMLWLIK
jgi:16S rRNA (uracil1498-N3)-methyltransferase